MVEQYQAFLREDLPRRIQKRLENDNNTEFDKAVKLKVLQLVKDCQEQSFAAFQTSLGSVSSDRNAVSSDIANPSFTPLDPHVSYTHLNSVTGPLVTQSVNNEHTSLSTAIFDSPPTFEQWVVAHFSNPIMDGGMSDTATFVESGYNSASPNRHSNLDPRDDVEGKDDSCVYDVLKDEMEWPLMMGNGDEDVC